jgi:type II secretory pathway component PulC
MSLGFQDKLRNRIEDRLRSLLVLLEKIPSLKIAYSKYSHRLVVPFVMLCGYLVGDLSALFLGDFLNKKFPKPKALEKSVRYIVEQPYIKNRSYYESVITRNHFCPGCVVPDFKSIAAIRPKDCGKAKPMPGAGIKVIGTIVLSDPQFSVATLSDGGAETTALKKGDRFKSFGKVFEIRRNRICFEKEDGILQAVEIPDESIKFGQPIPGTFPTMAGGTEGIAKVSENEVQIAKTLYQEKITDISTLQQAQAEAVKDSTGAIRGFKIVSLAPGSVFESLGFQAEDVIVGANGEPVNSLAKAQQLYSTAASTTEMQIEIERGGQRITKTFKVK